MNLLTIFYLCFIFLVTHISCACVFSETIEKIIFIPRDIYNFTEMNWIGVIFIYIAYWICAPLFALVGVINWLFHTRRENGKNN